MQPQFSTDLAALARNILRIDAPVLTPTVSQPRAVISCPTQIDIDDPTTLEARAAMAMAAQQMAAIIERHMAYPPQTVSLTIAGHDAKRLLSAYLRTYRRIAERQSER